MFQYGLCHRSVAGLPAALGFVGEDFEDGVELGCGEGHAQGYWDYGSVVAMFDH